MEDYIKLNVDGACHGGGSRATVVGRDHWAKFLGCASRVLNFGTPAQAEVEGILLALDCIIDNGLHNVIIESNALLIVNVIHSSYP